MRNSHFPPTIPISRSSARQQASREQAAQQRQNAKQEGATAGVLLESPAFATVCADVLTEAFQAISDSPEGELGLPTREAAYYRIRAINTIQARLRVAAESAQMAEDAERAEVVADDEAGGPR